MGMGPPGGVPGQSRIRGITSAGVVVAPVDLSYGLAAVAPGRQPALNGQPDQDFPGEADGSL